MVLHIAPDHLFPGNLNKLSTRLHQKPATKVILNSQHKRLRNKKPEKAQSTIYPQRQLPNP